MGNCSSSSNSGTRAASKTLIKLYVDLYRVNERTAHRGRHREHLNEGPLFIRQAKGSDGSGHHIYLEFAPLQIPLDPELPVMRINARTYVLPGPDAEYGIVIKREEERDTLNEFRDILEEYASVLSPDRELNRHERQEQRDSWASRLSSGHADVDAIVGAAALHVAAGAKKLYARMKKELTPQRMEKMDKHSSTAVEVTEKAVDDISDQLTIILREAYQRGINYGKNSDSPTVAKFKNAVKTPAFLKGRKPGKAIKKGVEVYDAIHSSLEAAADAMLDKGINAVVTDKRFGKDGAKSTKHGISAARKLNKLRPSKLLKRGAKRVARNVSDDSGSASGYSSYGGGSGSGSGSSSGGDLSDSAYGSASSSY